MNATARGFSLVELLVSASIALLAFGAALWSIIGLHDGTLVQPATSDLQQRARTALDLLARDIRTAGGGVAGAAAPAARMPLVLPHRIGAVSPDPELSAHADRVSVFRLLHPAAVPVAGSTSSSLTLEPSAACPVMTAACGFEPDVDVLVTDAFGAFDFGPIVSVSGPVLTLRSGTVHADYRAARGAWVAPALFRTYYLDRARRQLRVYDGYRSDQPVVDDVVGFDVRYFGDTRQAAEPRAPPGESNCLYDAAGRPLRPGAGLETRLVAIERAELVDGPACGQAPHRFDADLLRVRLVRVQLRVQAGPLSARAGDDRFMNEGVSRRASMQVPDWDVTLAIAVPNMQVRE